MGPFTTLPQVTGHLTDTDLIEFLKNAATGLRENGTNFLYKHVLLFSEWYNAKYSMENEQLR